MENSDEPGFRNEPARAGRHVYICLAVALIAAAIYLGCIISPPSLMDDVDAVQAQIARNMVSSGDWVTARLDGVAYLEKSPLIYWLIAISYRIFGFFDWAARIPMALACMALGWVTAAFGIWAFGKRAGFYAGLCVSTCIGLFLFTRILIPDVMLTATMALSMWAFLRVLDQEEPRPRLWAFVLAASLGVGLLWKSAIAVVFPGAAMVIYLLLTRQLFSRKAWQRLHPWSGLLVILLIAAPWHILATLRNPPYFDLTLRSAPGEYHGFLWFYFMNEQVLRFLNLRYPRDYNTVPRVYFWLFHLIWLFPWSVYFPAVFAQAKAPAQSRAARTRLLCFCWTGFILVFFTFSTTQEYYSMPCYPALALLLGSAMAAGGPWVRRGTRVLAVVSACAALACTLILVADRNVPNPGDITQALSQHPSAYTLSLGHMEDLTLESFAYLRLPLAMAAIAFAIGATGSLRATGQKAFLAAALMMVLFFHAARVAMVTFDPYLSSRPLAEALKRAPQGELVIDHHYYTFSSIFFYTNRTAWLLNGRFNNLVYGSYAPGAPNVFLDDTQWKERWLGPQRYYLVAKTTELPRFENLVGKSALFVLAESSGKVVLTNQEVRTAPLQSRLGEIPRP
jgi:4-amino-4-deoxy-L-arabinose transferase-like glycosyltransferase